MRGTANSEKAPDIIFKLLYLSICLSLLLSATAEAKCGMGDVEIHVAEITCYYCDNSLMEGGYKDVRGRWLDPDDRTCACPIEIPLDSEIILGGTGKWIDGLTYTNRDRGGAIVVDGDGVYHIDILVHSMEEANAFGRVRGYIVVRKAPSD